MANGNGNGNGGGLRGWALTVATGLLLSAFGLLYSGHENRIVYNDKRIAEVETTVHVGLSVINAKLDAFLHSVGVDPKPIEREAIKEASGETKNPVFTDGQ